MFGRIVARPIFEYSFPIDYRQSLECLPGARKRCGRTGKESLDIVDCLGACFLHGAEACHPDMHLRGIASDGPRCIAEERDLLRELVELLGAGEQDHTVCDLASTFYCLGYERGQHDRQVARIAQRLDIPPFRPEARREGTEWVSPGSIRRLAV